jgi:beta-mannosidase
MDLGGRWAAAEANEDLRRAFPTLDFDDSGWELLTVPGQWTAEPAFSATDGPVLYRRHFAAAPVAEDRRAWLVMEGIFYQSDVWLDGSYLGDTEGYFFPHTFDVTEALKARPEHVLAVEVTCDPPAKRTAKRNLTGIFGHWDCIDPSFNPGGIWAPVRLAWSGPVRTSLLRVTCPEASPEVAVLDLCAVLDAREATTAVLRTEVRRAASHGAPGAPRPGPTAAVERQQPLAAGTNRVRWRVPVPKPELWWPASLGDHPLYEVRVSVEVEGLESDATVLRTGLRQVRMHGYVWRLNGERLFLKGANLAPTRRDLCYASPEQVARDVYLAKEAGLDFLRVHAHIARPELYQAADELGMMLWQDLPLQWGYRGVRRQAVRQAAAAVDLLGHHPSVIMWCGHNEPFALDPPAGGAVSIGTGVRFLAGQMLPGWNKSVLDRSIRRALERADQSRPVVAHSGVMPHPAWGTDSHLYFGWYQGEFRGLPRALAAWPALARFVGELGAQAVPYTAGFMAPERWPELDWAFLEAHHALQKTIFDKHVPPSGYPTFEAWRDATQAYQATLVRFQVETLRRLKYRPTGGFAVFCLNDAQPAVSWSLLDHERAPKLAYGVLADACAPVIVVADWLLPSYAPGAPVSVDVHVVNDMREPLTDATVEARLSWPGGGRAWRFEGDVAGDSCAYVGRLTATLAGPGSAATSGAGGYGGIALDLDLHWGSPTRSVSNHYSSVVTT